MKNFEVTLKTEAGTNPFGMKMEAQEETLIIQAETAQEAANKAKVFMTIRPMGMVLRTFVDGKEVLGNF